MNQTNSKLQSKASGTNPKGDSAKLLSLLALAGGAVAMPQTSSADIIFTDLSANPVHVGPQSNSSYSISLPSGARLGFHTSIVASSINGVSSSRFVSGRQDAGYVRLRTQGLVFAVVNAGRVWNTGSGNIKSSGLAGGARYDAHIPGSYNDQYLLFEFKDSTQPGSPMRYGWVELSLNNGDGNTALPDLAIEGYAYDTSGAFLSSGQVPEPSAPALLALGALTLGAKGLRSWRKNRQTNTKA